MYDSALDADAWAQLLALSDRVDHRMLVEELYGLLVEHIDNGLIRREVDHVVARFLRHVAHPEHPGLAEEAEVAQHRLAATMARLDAPVPAAVAVSAAVSGRMDRAAATAATVTGAGPVLELVVKALRIEAMDVDLLYRLISSGQPVTEAVRCARILGRHRWWPQWMRTIVTSRALAGRADDALFDALQTCGFATLTPGQVNIACKLLAGDETAVDTAAHRLARMGEREAAVAQRLRAGDPRVVAYTAKLISL